MTPVSGLHFLRRARPGTAEVSLRHVSGWVIGGCRSSNLTVSNAALANASIDRHRYPQPTDPSVCRASAGPGPGDGWAAFPYARVSVPPPVKPGLLHGPMFAASSP